MEAAMTEANAPKDAAKRLEPKQRLMERMRTSIVDQGSYGIRQTAIWEKAYARAARFVKRELPTQRTLKNLISQLDAAHAWKHEPDQEPS
jgi:hypothetical protein